MRLTAENISKRRDGREILLECSLSVSSGECVLLRGPSGGGKSTLLRIMAFLEDADSGTIWHGEQSFSALSKSDRSAYPFLTVVFQQLFLWPNLTMAQNMAMVLYHDPNATLASLEIAMLERFSIAHLLRRLPHECSLGERQRLAVCRALLSKARFLLLDEPSSALDKTNRDLLIEELGKAAEQGRGALIVTHDDQGFDALASRCFELENGRLSEYAGRKKPA